MAKIDKLLEQLEQSEMFLRLIKRAGTKKSHNLNRPLKQ